MNRIFRYDDYERKIIWVYMRHYNCKCSKLATWNILYFYAFHKLRGVSWSWSYGIWICTYLCNKCISPLKWVRIPLIARCTRTKLCDKVRQWLATGRFFSSGTPVSSSNKTHRQDITWILLEMALSTTNITLPKLNQCSHGSECSAHDAFL
jgi:hypothetical protein